MQKTLGGDRLGSGKKQKIELHGYERSTQNLSTVWKNTQAPGTLVPFLKIIGLPGDTFDIDLNSDVRTHPTVGPLFASFKQQTDVFMCPIRLYHKYLHNNKLGVGMSMSNIKFPLLRITAPEIDPSSTVPPEFQQVNQCSLLAYLGTRGIAGDMSSGNVSILINGIPFLSYWDIFKNYYANKQEEHAYVIHAIPPSITAATLTVDGTDYTQYGAIALSADVNNTALLVITGVNLTKEVINYEHVLAGQSYIRPITDIPWDITVNDARTEIRATNYTGSVGWKMNGISLDANKAIEAIAPTLHEFDLNNIDLMRDAILAEPAAAAFDILAEGIEPYSLMTSVRDNNTMYAIYPQEGLAVKTYQSDIFNNWIKTEWLDGVNGISEITAIDTTSGSFTIDTLNLSKKVYDMLNRIALSGGSYQDYIEATYGHGSGWKPETPVYVGGLSKEIVFQEVVSTAEATAENPLGSLAGKGVMSNKHKGGKITVKVDEPCYIMGITSITPRIDYSQGNDFDTNLLTLDDLHKPALDQIGFQDLITEQMAFWDNTVSAGPTLNRFSAGKQPAWINYMTNYNKTYGNFADSRSEMFMTLNRRYAIDPVTKRIKDLTTYIDPSKFNYAFAQVDLSAMNFWVQISVDITARRKMSAKVIPNL